MIPVVVEAMKTSDGRCQTEEIRKVKREEVGRRRVSR